MGIIKTLIKTLNSERLPLSGYGSSSLSGAILGGASTPSGIAASLSAPATNSWVFSTVNRIASSVSSIPWKLYEGDMNGDRQEVLKHEALTLWNRANIFRTGDEFREASQQHFDLTGEMWWHVIGDNRGVPREMWLLQPHMIEPVPHPTEFVAGYKYRIGSQTIFLSKEEILFSRNPSPLNPYRGMGAIQALLLDLASDREAARFTHSFFTNSAKPGGIIEFPEVMQPADWQRFQEHWRETHQGTSNAHRVGIIEGGKWVDSKLTQRDMQFEQLRKLNRDTVLGAFGLHGHMLGISEQVNRANAEASEIVFSRWILKPRLTRIRALLNTHYLKLFRNGSGLHFDFVDPTPEDQALNLDRAERGYTAGLLTRNESRGLIGFDEVPDGDEFKLDAPTPFALSVSKSIEKPDDDILPTEAHHKATNIPDYPTDLNASLQAMERAWETRFRREAMALNKHLEQFTPSHPKSLLGNIIAKLEASDIDSYDWDWYEKYNDNVQSELAIAYEAALVAGGIITEPAPAQVLAVQYAATRSASLLRIDGDSSLVTATRDQMRSLVAHNLATGESLQTLQRSIRDDKVFSAARAINIARTETATALGEGTFEAAKMTGEEEKRWITQGDELVDPGVCEINAADGWIPLADNFSSGVRTIPGHPQCRCTVIFRGKPLVEAGLETAEQNEMLLDHIPGDFRCPQCNRLLGKDVAVNTGIWCRSKNCKVERIPISATASIRLHANPQR